MEYFYYIQQLKKMLKTIGLLLIIFSIYLLTIKFHLL